jgi:hypothetical protein
MEEDPDNIPLLPNMEDFHLGQPLELEKTHVTLEG